MSKWLCQTCGAINAELSFMCHNCPYGHAALPTPPDHRDEALKVAMIALRLIESAKGFTRLADCCVDHSCHINTDSGSCSFQTGIYYANGDRASEATEALDRLKELGVEIDE